MHTFQRVGGSGWGHSFTQGTARIWHASVCPVCAVDTELWECAVPGGDTHEETKRTTVGDHPRSEGPNPDSKVSWRCELL